MISLRHCSIKTKLTVLMMLISLLLLLVVSGIVLTSEYFKSRAELAQQLRVLSAALSATIRQSVVLGKYAEAEKQLETLSTQQHIHAAYLFDARGRPVAQYLDQSNTPLVWQALAVDFTDDVAPLWQTSAAEQLHERARSFALFTPIVFDDRRVGTLYLLSDARIVQERLGVVLFAVALALLLLFCASWLLAGWLQKPVSEPVINLSRIMTRVSEEQRYSLRVKKTADDEIGTLVDVFNRMLEQIEKHQLQQQQYQQHLEKTVELRTADLRTTLAELEEARAQADAANAAKSMFLARITHELRTPMIGVLGMNGLLLRTGLTREQKMLADTIQKSGEDLLAMVSDVLDLSRIEAGKMPLDIGPVDLAGVVQDVVTLLAPQARAKGLMLQTKITPTPRWQVEADRAKVSQILLNLVGNAIKFTSAGSVTVRLAMSETPDRMNVTCRFEVEDTGIGMKKEECRQVFALFHQLDNQSSRTRGGSGLGLAIVQQFVDLMEGSIDLSSQPGQGTRVALTFQFPRSLMLLPGPAQGASAQGPHPDDITDPAIVPAAKEGTAQDRYPSAGARGALYVGRHPALKQLLSLTLGRHGYQLVCADDIKGVPVVNTSVACALGFVDTAGITADDLEPLLDSGALPPVCYLVIDDQSPELSARARSLCAGVIRKPVRAEALVSALKTVSKDTTKADAAVSSEVL